MSPSQGQGPSDPAPSDRESEQPNAEQLAQLGIKVRDFAYESTLPPIAPVYFLPKQIQPDPRMMGPSQGPPMPLQLLPRLMEDSMMKSTEPAIRPGGVTRQRGFSNLHDYNDVPASQSQPCAPLSYSQISDEYIKTPVVTPNGSLQWQDPLSYSQHDKSPKNEPSFTTPSPLSSAHSSFSMPPSPMPGSKHRARRRSSRVRAQGKDLVLPSAGPASRYYLRKRPNRTSSPSSHRGFRKRARR